MAPNNNTEKKSNANEEYYLKIQFSTDRFSHFYQQQQ